MSDAGVSSDEITGLEPEIVENDVLTFVTKEQTRFPIQRNLAMTSRLVQKILETDRDETVIPLHNVRGEIMDKIITYMRHHMDNPASEIQKPLKSNNMREVVDDQWDAEFVDVSQDILFELILAANYMDVKPLLDLTCAKVASMLKGKTPEEIRKKFNIVNDFTPEEEAEVRAENRWADEP
uniref:Uncharacterized protein n=1 Tax=Spongospora subterranea TaxID=70186 RepID=A0A0H5RJL0_9EUKA|eukprot:CRZ08889.1 hypothetical protein [Spongospora subterranea]